ncbi:hypothetical protein KIH74_08435 [Kineosporia sp. J2-2]|uniref:Uncharacterized protein n=1 Tax=Kineosporia corallincola TaxID=2835133 RepID=A0ABS5TCY8_9ACTN|nr:hypothetical protein [Kineosporia corallincola]MBT0768950.1 hypothetical protein [Kineosporia corallincola]
MYRSHRRDRGTDREKRRADQGFALVAVVMTIAVLTLFMLTALAYTLNAMSPARRSQDAKAAEQAAVAGVDEYLSRLNTNDNYWKLGNDDSANAAFTAAGTTIQGTTDDAGNSTAARYSYQVLSSTSDTTTTGKIRIRVTGMSGPPNNSSTVKRVLTAELSRSGLLDFVYLSDIENIDPDLYAQTNGSACANYYYTNGNVAARPRTGCSDIQWGANDVVNGPLHSNDALWITGQVTFTSSKTETSWPATKGAAEGTKTWWGTQGAPLTGKAPVYADTLALPTSNNDLLKHVAPNIDEDKKVGKGCYYAGATRIVLQGTQMKVLSPSTTMSTTPSRCYNTSTPKVEQLVDIPPVIYVDSTATSCTFGALGYPASNELYTNSGNSATAWETAVVYNRSTYRYETVNYACGRGTVFVSGNASTQVTVAGADDVVVVGDLTVDSLTGINVIGLIAGNCVWVYHPVKSSSGLPVNLNSSANVSTIQAAILALRHSFVVQNWSAGAWLGTLTVNGAIAQKFRGPVGTSAPAGYTKNYVYDGRLTYTQPPYFLSPTNSPFKVLTLSDG